jgi:hypothetical protein
MFYMMPSMLGLLSGLMPWQVLLWLLLLRPAEYLAYECGHYVLVILTDIALPAPDVAATAVCRVPCV